MQCSGQTGAGKTYTAFGSAEEPGIVPRALEALFSQLEQTKLKLQLYLSLYELYSDKVYDAFNKDTLAIIDEKEFIKVKVDSYEEAIGWICSATKVVLQKTEGGRSAETALGSGDKAGERRK